MKIFKTLDSVLNKIEGALLVFLLLIMLFMAFGQVVLRNFFSGGIVWGDILLRHLVLWIGFLGAALATSSERHLNIDVVTRYLPERLKEAAAIISNVFAASVCFLLFLASVINFNDTGYNAIADNVPAWLPGIIIPIGFILLLIHFLIRAILNAGKALQKGTKA